MQILIDPRTKTGRYAKTYYKRMFLPAGAVAKTHKHKYDHLSILAQGCVKFSIEGEESVTYKAPAEIEVPANYHHEIRGIKDAVWYCLHTVDNEADAEGLES